VAFRHGDNLMPEISLSDPLIRTWAIAAALMILKTLAMAWLTVVRMMQEKGGYRAPEDLRQTRLNPAPDPSQLQPNERVERARRIHQNDMENVPYFIAGGFLFVLSAPPLWLAQVALYGYVLSRLGHFWAYATAQTHDTRATFWTIGVLILTGMTLWALVAALQA
jgi:glutathione S-transferase